MNMHPLDATGRHRTSVSGGTTEQILRRLGRPIAAGIVLAFSGHAKAEDVQSYTWGNDIAVSIGGEHRVVFSYLNEPDADGTQMPSSLKSVQHRLRLKPTLWLSELAQIKMQIGILDGQVWGGPSFPPTSDSADVQQVTPIRVDQMYSNLILPVGTVLIGRIPMHFGMGLYWHDGRTDDGDIAGFNTQSSHLDAIRWRFKPLGEAEPLETSVHIGVLNEGTVDPGFEDGLGRDDQIEAGARGDWLGDKIEGSAVVSYRTQQATTTHLWHPALYGRWDIPYFRLRSEGHLILGDAGYWPTFSPTGTRGVTHERTEVLSGGGALSIELRDVATSDPVVRFDRTGLETGFATGDDLGIGNASSRWPPAVEDGRYSMFRLNRDHDAGLVMWRYAQTYLHRSHLQQLSASLTAAGIGADDKQAVLAAATDLYTTTPSIQNAWWVAPHFVFSPGDFDVAVGGMYARLIRAERSRELLRANTTTYFDDVFRTSKSLGFELDTRIAYTWADQLVIELQAGLLFPGAVFDVEGASADPAILLQPRLTVRF